MVPPAIGCMLCTGESAHAIRAVPSQSCPVFLCRNRNRERPTGQARSSMSCCTIVNALGAPLSPVDIPYLAQMVSYRHRLFIFETAICMKTRKDINEDKTSFIFEKKGVTASQNMTIFVKKWQHLRHFWAPYCFTGIGTLVLESRMVSWNRRHVSGGRIPRSYLFALSGPKHAFLSASGVFSNAV